MSFTGQGAAPATAGELVQGTLNGEDFLITSPINLFSVVKAQLTEDGVISVSPTGDYAKVILAVRKLLTQMNFHHLGVQLTFNSAVPRGKGLASSTSEMLAALRAVLKATHRTLSPAQLAHIATEVESSDSLFFPGVVRGNPLTGQLYQSYGTPPPLSFVLVDNGGVVITEKYDRGRARAHSQSHQPEMKEAVELVEKGFRTRSPALIAEGATLSAKLHQSVLFKPLFEDLVEATASVGGLGVNCAHTGTVLGVMFDPRKTNTRPLMSRVEEIAGRAAVLGCYRLIPSDARVS